MHRLAIIFSTAYVGLLACVSLDSHENFKSFMQSSVGRDESDPYASIVRYSEYVVARRELGNGNTEVEYLAGRRRACRVFFEIDKTSRKIIAWRYEGDKDACAIVP